MLQIAHARQILIEPAAIAIAELALQVARLIGDGVENALAGIELANLRIHFFRRALKEQLLENIRRPPFRRNRYRRARPGKTARPGIHAKRQRRKTCESAQTLGDELIE